MKYLPNHLQHLALNFQENNLGKNFNQLEKVVR